MRSLSSGFPKLGVPFLGGPYHEDYLGSILGSPTLGTYQLRILAQVAPALGDRGDDRLGRCAQKGP